MAEVDYGGMNAVAQKEVAVSENPVHIELDKLERNLETIEARINGLYKGMLPVLSPSNPMPTDPNKVLDKREQSPLAMRVNNMADHAFELGAKVQELIDRLEI
jgi:hypothetical protein